MLFALPFVVFGLMALIQGVRRYDGTINTVMPIIVGSIFTAVGLLILFAARFGSASAAKKEELQQQNPSKPWMWREDWATGVIKDNSKGAVIGLWIFAILWNAIATPVSLLVVRPEI